MSSAKRRGKIVPKTKIASNWLSEEETPKARKKDTYKCFCNKRYSSAAYLARHILKHHAPTNGVSTEDGSASQEGEKSSSNIEIPGPTTSNGASTKNTRQDSGTRVEEGTSSVHSSRNVGKGRSTKAPRKKLKPKGRAKPASTYKCRNRQHKTDTKTTPQDGNTQLDLSDVITPKVEIDLDDPELANSDPIRLGDLDTIVEPFPQSVYDFDDASDDEGIVDLPDFKVEEFEDDVSFRDDAKQTTFDGSTTMSMGTTTTSGIGTPGSTPAKKRVTKTYQGGLMKRLHACHICSKTYSSVGKLKRHMKSHTEEGQKRLFTCGICQKSFNSNSVLIAHIRVHTGEKPFKCDECKMAFKQTSHLNRHKRVHSGEKPFTCEICGKGFPHNFNLVIHRRKHTGEKPYVCNVCNHPFADRSNLNKHMPRCLKRLCEQIDVLGSLDDSSDELGSERRKKNAINKIKSEFNQGESDDNLFDDDMSFPVTYEQVITQTVEEVPGTSAYMDDTYHTAEEGSSFELGGIEGHGMGQSLIRQIEPSRMMKEVDVTFVEGEPTDGDLSKKVRRRDFSKKGEVETSVSGDNSTPKKRSRPKQNTNFPAPKRQVTPRRRSPKKNLSTPDKDILPQTIFQDDSNVGPSSSRLAQSAQTISRREESPGHSGSDFAMLAEQILDDHLPMESESNLTAELLIPVDSGWIDHPKSTGKMMQHEQRRPPPVSELFKLTRPPEMDDPPPVHTSPSSYTPAISHNLTWSSQRTILSPISSPMLSTAPQMPNPTTESNVLPTLALDKPTEYTPMEIDQPFHASPTLLSPTHARQLVSPGTLGTEVEEVYAHYPDTNYDQGLEVDTKNIIISEPDRNY